MISAKELRELSVDKTVVERGLLIIDKIVRDNAKDGKAAIKLNKHLYSKNEVAEIELRLKSLGYKVYKSIAQCVQNSSDDCSNISFTILW